MSRLLCTGLSMMSLWRPALASAQSRDTVAAPLGALVRVLPTGDTAWRAGRLTALTADSLTLRACHACDRPTFARAQLRRVEVRLGLPGTRRQHTVIGMTAGALLTASAGVINVQRCEARERSRRDADGPPCALGYALVPLAAVAGLFVGGFIGATVPAERWHPAGVAR